MYLQYSLPIGAALPPEIRVYRSAALSTGSAGTLSAINWDTESLKRNFTHSTSSNSEQITVLTSGTYDYNGNVLVGSGSWSEFRVTLEVDSGGGFTEIDRVSVPGGTVSLGLLNSGPGSAKLGRRIDLVAGNIIRLRCATFTTGSIALTVGQSSTWFQLRQI